MLRLVLLAGLVLFVVAGGIAVALYQALGWQGLIAFPFIIAALIWVAKSVIGKSLKRLLIVPFAMKAAVLRGATMAVHSITPVPRPPDEPSDEPPAESESPVDEDGPDDEDEESDDAESSDDEAEKPKHYYVVDITITPQASGEGRVWEPGELMLTCEPVSRLEDLVEKEVGAAQECLVWNGSEFGPDDPGKYPGEQRLKVTFAAKPGISRVWLNYYNVTIGPLDFPAWNVVG